MITGELKNSIDKIWNDFWTNGISNSLTVIEQFTYLIFLKRLDDKQLLKEKEANLLGVPMENPIYTPEQARLRWSNFKNKDPETMFDLFRLPQRDLNDLTVFDFMKTIGTRGGLFAEYMKGATFMIDKPKLLDKVVQQIDKLPLEKRDAKGDLYEYMLSKIAEAGKNGQFRTPRHIIRMMVEMTQPKKNDTICDPACGTAGFLVAAGEYLNEKHQDWFFEADFRNHYNKQMFNGTEFDTSMLRIAAMNMQLHGIENPNLVGKDSLSKTNDDVNDAYSLILANPPFKGSLDYDDVEPGLLKITKTKKTELLFISLILRQMKTGGRAAVIVPDGVLFGSSNAHKTLRKELVENQQLQGVISMPSGVFKPYAGVSTAILFFTKTNSGGTDKVWFYDMKTDGLSLDDKRNLLIAEDDFEKCFTSPATMLEEVKGKCDIPQIIQDWNVIANCHPEQRHPELVSGSHSEHCHPELVEGKKQSVPKEFQDRTSQSFLVPKNEIKENDYDLSINRYKEIIYEEITYDAPATIIADIKAIDKQRTEAIANLEKMLG